MTPLSEYLDNSSPTCINGSIIILFVYNKNWKVYIKKNIFISFWESENFFQKRMWLEKTQEPL